MKRKYSTIVLEDEDQTYDAADAFLDSVMEHRAPEAIQYTEDEIIMTAGSLADSIVPTDDAFSEEVVSWLELRRNAAASAAEAVMRSWTRRCTFPLPELLLGSMIHAAREAVENYAK